MQEGLRELPRQAVAAANTRNYRVWWVCQATSAYEMQGGLRAGLGYNTYWHILELGQGMHKGLTNYAVALFGTDRRQVWVQAELGHSTCWHMGLVGVLGGCSKQVTVPTNKH